MYTSVYRLPVLQPRKDARAFCVYMLVAGLLVLLGYIIRQYGTCISIFGVCTHEIFTCIGTTFGVAAITRVVLKTASACICCTALVHKDWVYTIALMYRYLVHMVAGIIVVLLNTHTAYMNANILSSMYLAWSTMKVVQHGLKFLISKRTVWGAYWHRIEVNVFKRAVIANVHAFISGARVLHTTKPRHAGLYSIHQALQVLRHEDDSVEDNGTDLYRALCSKLHYCSNVGGSCNSTSNGSGSTTILSPGHTFFRQATSPKRFTLASAAAAASPPRPTPSSALPAPTLAKLQVALPPAAAADIMQLFDADEDGCITEAEFCSVLEGASKQRASLFQSLDDYASMVETLDTVIGCVVHVILFFVLLWIVGINIIEKQIGIISILILFGLAYGSTLQRVFEGCVLVFVWRPYDVNDRILLEGETGSALLVRRIALLSTEFERTSDGQKLTIPHTIVQTRAVTNISRSGPFTLLLHFTLPSTDALDTSALATTVDATAKRTSSLVHSTSLGLLSVRSDGAGTIFRIKVHFSCNNGGNAAVVDQVRESVSRVLQQQLLHFPILSVD